MASLVEEEEEEEVASEEEKLAIVQHFLLNAPPGEFDEVKSDALSLVSEDLVSPEMLAGIARAYNTATLRAIALEDSGRKLIVCKESELGATLYLEPSSGATYTVDHVLATATREATKEEVSALSVEKAAIDAAMQTYVTAQYGSAGAVAVYADDTDVLKIVISGEKINLRNYWSGNWRSTWAVDVKGNEATVSGTLKVRAHYFEDGNVQLQTAKEFPPTKVTFSTNIGPAVADLIDQAEAALQAGLEEMYSNMSHETFKAMRRVMPITRTKMKYVFYLHFYFFFRWNIHEIALNRNLRK